MRRKRDQHRAVEQVLIKENGGPGGGQHLNKINSIARSNPIYEQSIQRGCEIPCGRRSEGAQCVRLEGGIADADDKPGTAFSLVCDLGFVVGLMTSGDHNGTGMRPDEVGQQLNGHLVPDRGTVTRCRSATT